MSRLLIVFLIMPCLIVMGCMVGPSRSYHNVVVPARRQSAEEGEGQPRRPGHSAIGEGDARKPSCCLRQEERGSRGKHRTEATTTCRSSTTRRDELRYARAPRERPRQRCQGRQRTRNSLKDKMSDEATAFGPNTRLSCEHKLRTGPRRW